MNESKIDLCGIIFSLQKFMSNFEYVPINIAPLLSLTKLNGNSFCFSIYRQHAFLLKISKILLKCAFELNIDFLKYDPWA